MLFLERSLSTSNPSYTPLLYELLKTKVCSTPLFSLGLQGLHTACQMLSQTHKTILDLTQLAFVSLPLRVPICATHSPTSLNHTQPTGSFPNCIFREDVFRPSGLCTVIV